MKAEGACLDSNLAFTQVHNEISDFTILKLRCGCRRIDSRFEAVELILHDKSQCHEALHHRDRGRGFDLKPAGCQLYIARQTGHHSAAEILGQRNAQGLRFRRRFGFEPPAPQALLDRGRCGHRVQEGEQGRALDEVCATYGLDLSDCLHQHLCGSPAYAEEVFDVLATPGFGSRKPGPLQYGIEVAGPFDGSGQSKRLL